VSLRRYILRRLALFVPVLIGLSMITFLISHVVPGDPAAFAAGPNATPQQIEKVRQQFGLNLPLPEQYLRYLWNLLHGNLGLSIVSHHPVTEDLVTYFPNTVELVVISTIITVAVAIPLALWAAVGQNRWPDHVARIMSLGSMSLPSFWVAIMLQIAFAMLLRWLPVGGVMNPLYTPPPTVTHFLLIDTLLARDWSGFWDAFVHTLLPSFTLALGQIAFLLRILRSDVIETLRSDWVRMLHANGVPNRVTIWKYILKNSMLATVSVLGFTVGFALSGSVVIETVFDWPGIGLYSVNSALTLDFEPVMGATLLIGIAFLVVNLVTDIAYGFLDPRIRYG
jgi:peptide/nickel transport system permease protein